MISSCHAVVRFITCCLTVYIPDLANLLSEDSDSHCNRINFSLMAVSCFNNGYVGKQPVAWKDYCVEYWLIELQESMDRCIGRCDKTEILLKKP